MHHYDGKVVFITGGSSGIGLAAARAVVAAGGEVAIAARGAERLEAARRELEGLRRRPDQRVRAFGLDVSDATACDRVAREVVEAFGCCDVVLANAGVAHPSRILETPTEVYERMMRINYFGTVHAVRAFLPHFFERGSGRIGVVSSMLGFMGIYGYSAYAASKFAQVGFAECLRQELVGRNVTVTICYPPDTDTPQLAEENLIKPPETKAISGEVETMRAEAVAEALLHGVARGKLHVVPSAMGKFTRFMVRHAPGLVRWVIDGELAKFRRRTGAEVR
jgi:3-dehydrosphinganine reductase